MQASPASSAASHAPPGVASDRRDLRTGWRCLHGQPPPPTSTSRKLSRPCPALGSADRGLGGWLRRPRARPRAPRLTSDWTDEEPECPVQPSVIALPSTESESVVAEELAGTGFEVFRRVLHETRRARDKPGSSASDVAVAILDGETDFDKSLEYYAALHDEQHRSPRWWLVSAEFIRSAGRFPRMPPRRRVPDPNLLRLTRSPGGSRLCIRRTTVDDGSGAELSTTPTSLLTAYSTCHTDRRGLQPEGRRRQDDDRGTSLFFQFAAPDARSCSSTPTRSPVTSPPRSAPTHFRTVSDSWRDEAEGGNAETLVEIASAHSSV